FPEFKIGSIDIEFLNTIKKFLPDLEEIKFHGLGEPFLAKETIFLHERIRTLYPNANVISITNAAMSDLPFLVKNYLDHIIISIDHAQKDILERMRRKINYDVLVANVLKLTEKNTKNQPCITINCCFTSETYKDLCKMINFSNSLGVKDIRCNLVQNWVSDNSFSISDVALDTVDIDELAEAILNAFRIADALGVTMKIIGNPDFTIEGCVWSRKMIYITESGEIAPCCMRTEPTHYFGSFLKRPFRDIWFGKEMNVFRQNRIKGHYPTICRNCPYLINAAVLKELEKRGVALTNDFFRHTHRDHTKRSFDTNER
ncbi:SPASM domain-containing protein, partial [Candidatus Omnitrophota bacterium]